MPKFKNLVGGDQFKPHPEPWPATGAIFLKLTSANNSSNINTVRIPDGDVFRFSDDTVVELITGPSVEVEKSPAVESLDNLMGFKSQNPQR